MEEFVFEEESTIEATFQMDLISGNHNDLDGRDLPNQHPMSSITGLETALDGKVDKTDESSKVYGTNSEGNQTTYDVGSFGQVDDVTVGGVSVVTNKIAELGTMAGETASDYSTKAVADTLYADISYETTIENHIADKNNPHEVTKTQVGLGNVDNTSDLNKPISTATQTALDGKANKATTLAGYGITDAYTKTEVDTALSGKQNNLDTTQMAAVNSGANATNIGQITTNTNSISSINELIPSAASSSNQLADKSYVDTADNNLQSQIDAITAASDVTDIVGTYAELQAYDTSSLPNNSIIKVLQDESRDDETTYYRWVITGGVGSWVLIGEEGPYYTKSETDTLLQAKQNEITSSNKLSADLVDDTNSTNKFVTASDISTWNAKQNALTAGTGIDITSDTISNSGVRSVSTGATNGTISVNTNGTSAEVAVYGLGSAAYTASTAYDASGAASTAETNAKNYADGLASNYATAAQGALADTALQPNDNITQLTNNAGYITGITSTDVTTALGYTPYDSSNPSGYTSNTGTVTSVNNVSPVNGNVSLTIPTVNNSTITITQGGVTKGSFTLNQASGDTIALDAGGGSSYTAGTGIDITSNVISVASPTLTNNTTHGLSILGTTSNTYSSTSIGKYSNASGLGSIAISDSYGSTIASGIYATCVGGDSSATGTGATAFGSHAKATADYAIQIGYGTNSEANSFYVATSSSNNWKMLGSDGKIPSGRLTIATSVSSSSTNDETVGAKLFYDTCGDIETLINAL